ncbi:phosphodiesterase, MJ0936 family [Ferroglobus placidus DSM 10642]|uniref:Phosphoesterase n=1 Tax=Ferroglobus placidus (strain DSM 10642 / AEDII12DO) TaxID=589924 RepID=D3S1E1_FERPA|nr:metallophosphoesterase [Ferroglobus placidus]ADC66405.1 phosphodiesterase, MJ0936 family [Ferroglobus placidus DSM 10642]
MRLLCLSDTHCEKLEDLPKKVLDLMDEVDLVVHAGDFTSLSLYEEIERRKEIFAVRGNADDEELKKLLPEEVTFEVEGVRFGVVHRGNYLNEFYDLGYKAKELGVKVLVFGHVHRFVLQQFGDVIVLCPGSPTQPRLSVASCAVLKVENGKVNVEFVIADEVACGMDVRLKT